MFNPARAVSRSSGEVRMRYAAPLGPGGAKCGRNSGASRHRAAWPSVVDGRVPASAAVAKRARNTGVYFLLGEETCVAYIICEPCIGTKDSACVDVCPVDCIHPRKDEPAFASTEMLYIHPDECIDCGACVPACPVEAIFSLDETPEKWAHFIPKNAEYYQT
jgi:ferredoxin